MTWFTVKEVVPGTCNDGGMVKVKMRGGLGGLFEGKIKQTHTKERADDQKVGGRRRAMR